MHSILARDNGEMMKFDRGNVLIIGSTVSFLLALTWGGIQFSWHSSHVLVPLVIGGVGIVVFMVVEALWTREPTVRRIPHRVRSSAHLPARCPNSASRTARH